MQQTILVCDDEKEIVEAISIYLEGEGYKIIKAYDGLEALDILDRQKVDLVIIDVMMPGLDGYSLARKVRADHCGTPILMLTAKSATEDRIEGLNAGADYYLPKPFDTRELLACINALLRRQGKEIDELSFGNTRLELSTGMLCCENISIRLSAREFDVMRLLLQTKEQIIPKEVILSRVWGLESNAVENHVEVYIGFLRKKLKSIHSNLHIEAIRRMGYYLEVSEE